MNKRTKIYLIGGAAIAGVAVFLWFYYFSIDRVKAIEIIKKHLLNTKYNDSSFNSAADEYLINWAKAIRTLRATFKFQGAEFSTATGIDISTNYVPADGTPQ